MPVYYGQIQQVVKRKVLYGDPADARDADLSAFFALWESARGARPMPIRGDIDPKGMRKYLPMVQLYDVLDGGDDFRFRVSGTEVFLVNGVDMTGRTVSSHPNKGVRERLMNVLRHVAVTGKPVYAHFESLEDYAVFHHVVESVYLPLGAGDTAEQIIGLTVFSDER